MSPEGPVLPNPTRWPPVDEASRDPDLVAFRERLLAAVRSKDWPALSGLMHPRIGFGPDYFDAKVRLLGDFWGMPDPESPLWWKLERALAWGGRFSTGGLFMAPAIALPAGLDPDRCLVAAGPDVPMRAAPDLAAPVVTRLDHAIVTLVAIAGDEPPPPVPAADWHTARVHHGRPGFDVDGHHHVKAPDGTVGFVHHRDLISPFEHQAYLQKVEDGRWWSLVAFVAAGSLPPEERVAYPD